MAGIWARLGLVAAARGLRVVYTDSLEGEIHGTVDPGAGAAADDLFSARKVGGGLATGDLRPGPGRLAPHGRLAQQILDRLAEVVARNLQAGDDLAVPLLVAPDKDLQERDWESSLYTQFKEAGLDIDIFRDASGPFVIRRRTQGPMELAVYRGHGQPVDVESFRSATVQPRLVDELEWTSSRGLASRAEILIVPSEELPRVTERIHLLSADERPLLTIGMGEGAMRYARRIEVPGGSAVLGLEGRNRPEAASKVIADLAAGRSLHQAVQGVPRRSALLVSGAGLLDARMAPLDFGIGTRSATVSDPPPRSIDLAISLAGTVSPPYLRFGTVLAGGERYCVHLRIGERYAQSLLREAPEPIENLLPPSTEGWDLHVALFTLDFAVEDDTVRPLHLPGTGCSDDEVVFEVVAPPVEASRVAQLRIVVLFRNNPVQSFLVRSLVVPSGSQPDGLRRDGVHATLEASRRDAIDDLDDLPARDVFIGANLDPATGSHTLMVAGEDGKATLPYTVEQAKALIAAFRTELQEAYGDPDHPNYPRAEPGELENGFKGTIRRLAFASQDLRWSLAFQDQSFLPVLNRLRASQGRVIHITRYEPSFALPWVALYDWDLPTDIANAEVCDGKSACRHFPPPPIGTAADALCVRGFWGYRHVIEERIGEAPSETRPVRARPATADEIVVSVDKLGTTARKLLESISDATGFEGMQAFSGSEVDLLEAMWSSDRVTRLAVLIGHFQATPAVSEKPEYFRPYLELGLPQFRLPEWRIAEMRQKHEGPVPPGLVVFVLGCSTVTDDLTRLFDFVQSFLNVGAGPVVATASAVSVGLACDFAQKVCHAMLAENEPLGEAVRQWRCRLLGSGNPLAFSFIAYGDASVNYS